MKYRQLMNLIQVSLLLFFSSSEGTDKDIRFYCDGHCDVVRERCSCESTCLQNRNCCTDYQQSCHGASSWKDTECSSPSDVVCPDGYENLPPLIVLSIDGYRDIYFNRNFTPTITKLASCGVKIPYMISAYPTKTFSNHYTIATGLYPESHGIISNTIYDHERGMKFRPGNSDSFSPHWWGGEPIWVTASNQGLKSASYFWPGSEINITRYPDYYHKFDSSVPLEERVYQLLDWLDLPEEDRPAVMMIYQDIVDRAGHKDGPFGLELNASLALSENMVEMIMHGLRDRNLENCVNFAIVSDHGMASVDCQNKITFLEEYGLNLTELTFDAGAFVRIGKSLDKSLWNKFNPKKIKRKLQCKRETAHWEAYLKYEYLPKRFHYANNKLIEDVHLVVDDEHWVGVKDDPDCDPGGHGYDNAFVDMRAFFTAHGPAFKRSYDRSLPLESIELYNLFSDILGLIPAPNNGTSGSLYDMMKNPPRIEKNPVDSITECPVMDGAEWTCPSCQGISQEELADTLVVSPEEAEEFQRHHLLYGNTDVSRRGAKYCMLSQSSYINIFHVSRSIPLISSFVLASQETSKVQPDSFCAQRDIRVDNEATFSCSLWDEDNSNATFTYFVSPGLVEESEALVSSNLVPVYNPFSEIWKFLSRNLRRLGNSYGALAVQVGPIYDYNFDGHADTPEELRNVPKVEKGSSCQVPVPTHYFIILSRCRDEVNNRTIKDCSQSLEHVEFLNFIIPNFKELPCHKEEDPIENWLPEVLSHHIARIRDIELLTGISFFSKWTSAGSNEESTLLAIREKLVLPEMSDRWRKDLIGLEEVVTSTRDPDSFESSTTSSTNRGIRFSITVISLIVTNALWAVTV